MATQLQRLNNGEEAPKSAVQEEIVFKYQPDIELDTEEEKAANEAELRAHPGNRYFERRWEAANEYRVWRYIEMVPARTMEPQQVLEEGQEPQPQNRYDRLDLFRLARQMNAFDAAEKLRNQQRAREETKAAKKHINQYKCEKVIAVDSKLPESWTVIVSNLACSVSQDLEAARNCPGPMAALLAVLSLTCKEMRYLVKSQGFPALAHRVPKRTWEDLGVASTAGGEMPPVWGKLVSDPHTCQLPELKDACRQVKVKLTGSKGQLIIRLQEYLGITKPQQLPPAVIFSMKWEKTRLCVDKALLEDYYKNSPETRAQAWLAVDFLETMAVRTDHYGGRGMTPHEFVHSKNCQKRGQSRILALLAPFPFYYNVRVDCGWNLDMPYRARQPSEASTTEKDSNEVQAS